MRWASAIGWWPSIEYSDFPPEAKAKATLGSYLKPDLEPLVAAAPDLVLGTGVHRTTTVPALDERKIPMFILEPQTLPEVFDSIVKVGQLTGTDQEATQLVASLRKRSDAVASQVAGKPRPRTFVELSPQLHSAGKGTFLHDMLDRAGGDNIAADAGMPWPQLSQEAIVLANPETIILNYGPGGETPDQVKARPGWGAISAVKNGRVINVDPDLANRPGPRAVDGLEAMAAALHPGVIPSRNSP